VNHCCVCAAADDTTRPLLVLLEPFLGGFSKGRKLLVSSSAIFVLTNVL